MLENEGKFVILSGSGGNSLSPSSRLLLSSGSS